MVAITDITTGAIAGTGYFDKLMVAVKIHLTEELSNNRILQTEYATVYLGALQTVLGQAIQFAMITEQVDASIANTINLDAQSAQDLLNKAAQLTALQDKTASEIALLAQRTLTEKAQINDIVDGITIYAEDSDGVPTIYLGSLGKQQGLQKTQANSFNRDAEQKALKILTDIWSVSKSVSGDSIDTPDGARNDDIEDLIIKLRQGIRITSSIYKLAADAGSAKLVVAGEYVLLDASNSTTPFDDLTAPEVIATYAWVQLSGTNAAITDATLEVTSITAPAVSATLSENILVFQLTITSDLGNTRVDTVEITVE